jgi:hypothetical protein
MQRMTSSLFLRKQGLFNYRRASSGTVWSSRYAAVTQLVVEKWSMLTALMRRASRLTMARSTSSQSPAVVTKEWLADR